MYIIGLTGARGSGKSTAAAGLDRGGDETWIELSFAEDLKSLVEEQFGLAEESVFGTQEQKDAYLGEDWLVSDAVADLGRPWSERYARPWSGRYLCEYVGEMFRRADPDHWVKKVRADIEAWRAEGAITGVVISDLRYPNEADMVHDLGGDVIHVAVEDEPTPVSNGHTSDQPLGDEYIDAYAAAPRGDVSGLVARVRELAGCRKRDEAERLAQASDAVFEKAIELVRDFRSAHVALEYVGRQAFNNSGAMNKTGLFWRLVAEQIRKVCDAPSLQKSANMAKDEEVPEHFMGITNRFLPS